MDWGSTNERWARIIEGESMSPLLQPGDIVVFEDRKWDQGHVVHAFDGGEDLVKVARGFGEDVRLIPVNPEYPVISGKTMNIKGVAVERIRKLANDVTETQTFRHGMRHSVSTGLPNN